MRSRVRFPPRPQTARYGQAHLFASHALHLMRTSGRGWSAALSTSAKAFLLFFHSSCVRTAVSIFLKPSHSPLLAFCAPHRNDRHTTSSIEYDSFGAPSGVQHQTTKHKKPTTLARALSNTPQGAKLRDVRRQRQLPPSSKTPPATRHPPTRHTRHSDPWGVPHPPLPEALLQQPLPSSRSASACPLLRSAPTPAPPPSA